jgi:hypothetical protein
MRKSTEFSRGKFLEINTYLLLSKIDDLVVQVKQGSLKYGHLGHETII